MKKIPLTQGQFALIDDEDFERVSQFKWTAWKGDNIWYARRDTLKSEGDKIRTEYLHCFLLGRKGIDHRDGNGLNCQRFNLRPATQIQNGQNKRKHKIGSSAFKGVHFYKRLGRWVSYITVDKRRIHLGYFEVEEYAAIAYDGAAKLFFGEFAKPNFS